LTSKVRGEVEKEDNILIIRRIFVTYYLRLADDQRETAERVHRFHVKFCPVARSIQDCIEIETDLIMESL
jgi:organic hydroperoxide reductase OsmC/OhrA